MGQMFLNRWAYLSVQVLPFALTKGLQKERLKTTLNLTHLKLKQKNMKSVNYFKSKQVEGFASSLSMVVMNLFKIILALMIVNMLVACESTQRRIAREEEANRQAIADRAVYLRNLGDRCSQYGFKQGTPPFAQCIQNAEQQDDAQRANMMQLNMQSQQLQQQQFQRASCFATGRLDC